MKIKMTKKIAQIIGASLVILAGVIFVIIAFVKGILTALLVLRITGACIVGLSLFICAIVAVWEAVGELWG